MDTQQWQTSEKDLQQAAQVLRAGGLVAFPTETVYGLGTLGLDPNCVKKLYEAKGRPGNNPVILHVGSVQQGRSLVACQSPVVQKRFNRLTRALWPGPLTLVCPKAPGIPHEVTAGLPLVAIRFPSHPVAGRLLELVDAALAAPSANASTRPSATHPSHVLATLDGRIDGVICGGSCQMGMESTVVDISRDQPAILRAGAVGIEELQRVLQENCLAVDPIASIDKPVASGSPGCMGKHYAPNIGHIELVTTQKVAQFWHTDTSLLLTKSTNLSLLRRFGKKPRGFCATLPNEPVAYAKRLYGRLYELEQEGLSNLVIEIPSWDQKISHRLMPAILDRLRRICL